MIYIYRVADITPFGRIRQNSDEVTDIIPFDDVRAYLRDL